MTANSSIETTRDLVRGFDSLGVWWISKSEIDVAVTFVSSNVFDSFDDKIFDVGGPV